MYLPDRLREECCRLNHIRWVLRKREQYSFPETWQALVKDWIKKCGAMNIYYLEIKQYYDQFIDSFWNNPLSFMNEEKMPPKIVTDRIDCYLIELDGYTLPIGFLKELDRNWRISIRSSLDKFLYISTAETKNRIEKEQELLKKINMAVKLQKDVAEIQKKVYADKHECISQKIIIR